MTDGLNDDNMDSTITFPYTELGFLPGLNCIEAPRPAEWRPIGAIFPRGLWTKCPCNGRWQLCHKDVVLFKYDETIDHRLTLFECTTCHIFVDCPMHNKNYEPTYIGMGQTAIHKDLILEYMSIMMTMCTTFYGYCEHLKLRYTENHCRYRPPDIKIFRKSFFNWAKLEQNNSEAAYGCSICGPLPRIILLDATSLVFNSDRSINPEDPSYGKNVFRYWRDPIDQTCEHLSLIDQRHPNHPRKSNAEKGKDRIQDVEGADECNKLWTKLSQRTGGCFTCLCEHGLFLGFHLVMVCEGRKDPYWVMEQFFPDPPEIVVYDFACSLASYARSRNDRYKKTMFYIDSFHQRGHKCGTTFQLPRDEPALGTLRSSIPEIFNRVLKNIKTPIRYMSQRNVFDYIDLYITLKNEARAYRLSQSEF